MVEKIQRVEGLVIGIASLYFYNQIDADWLMFFLLFLVPDVTMLGYLKNKKIGAWIYNLGHTYALAVVLLLVSHATDSTLALEISIIWIAHISFDRVFKYGLKREHNFQHTHLGWVGKHSIVSEVQNGKKN